MTIDEKVLDEAILEFKERAEYSRKMSELGLKSYIPKEKEEKQIAEWLEELKALRHEANELRKAGYAHGHTDGYDKAIDEAKSVILQTLDNEMLIDTLHLRLEQLKE